MGKYVVTNGQNLYDVALDLYGSIEGIVDLLMNNTGLSLADDLRAGDKLVYTDDFAINADVVAYNHQHGIVPANGEHSVYPKYFGMPYFALFCLRNTITSAGFGASGNGQIEIDWGDNSPVETIKLSRQFHTYTHIFDNEVREQRKIRWYSKASFVRLDWSNLQASIIYLLRPLMVEELVVRNTSAELHFLPLAEGLYEVNLHGLKTDNLSPLIPCRKLMRLDLTDASIKPTVIDKYLKQLVSLYGARRNCEVLLPVPPSGIYREPERDENGRYLVALGMEAIWVITHEPSWNEGGAWKFIVGNQIYTIEA